MENKYKLIQIHSPEIEKEIENHGIQKIYLEMTSENYNLLINEINRQNIIVIRVNEFLTTSRDDPNHATRISRLTEEPKNNAFAISQSSSVKSQNSKRDDNESKSNTRDNNEQIMTLKKHHEKIWKDTIIENLNKAIEKRNKTELIYKIAKEWGYKNKNGNIDPRGVYLVLQGRGNIFAQDILILEKKFGIHRDEILGPIDTNRISDIRVFRKLNNIFNRYPDDSLDIKNALNAFIDALEKDNPNVTKAEVAIMIKNLIEREILKKK
ncbi:hypothetical protein [Saccharococcus caldoxylosilyticus]|uniref:Uncharacterized protein n=1 Tax=Parageobacillus caldoxylosilyticus NBRC 107762 TaxID=1220594 RepID=A0A023DKD5_9BACL|nr:hypothetical protein [Parageobacillus caldoxylosilyticus]MBB3854384.1 hypothetical protein [Parageobacillus caldoxylosilyticus]GAJ41476.1 hypothetical protein GCA01S_071_00150 [Parageobacillus caldoxylosilyticus NBRC 107762]